MIVLDANVLIAHLAVVDDHRDRAFEILDTEVKLSVHPVTLAEVLVRPARDGEEEAALRSIVRLGVGRLLSPDDEPQNVARLRARTGLRLPDCYVLVAAERGDAELATFDARLASVARARGVIVQD